MGDMPHEFVTLHYPFSGHPSKDGVLAYTDWCELDGEWSWEITFFSDVAGCWVAKRPQYGGVAQEPMWDGPANWGFILVPV